MQNRNWQKYRDWAVSYENNSYENFLSLSCDNESGGVFGNVKYWIVICLICRPESVVIYQYHCRALLNYHQNEYEFVWWGPNQIIHISCQSLKSECSRLHLPSAGDWSSLLAVFGGEGEERRGENSSLIEFAIIKFLSRS